MPTLPLRTCGVDALDRGRQQFLDASLICGLVSLGCGPEPHLLVEFEAIVAFALMTADATGCDEAMMMS